MRSRFFHPAPWQTEHPFPLSTELHHYVSTVLRMKTGDLCELFDGEGTCATAQITHIDKKSTQVQWTTPPQLTITNESPLRITLAQCLSSAEKMDWTIEKAVELGAHAITPLFSNRSQIKLSPERIIKKQEHWQRIITAACAQSGRNRCPKLNPVQHLTQWLQTHTTDTYALILHPDTNAHNTRLRDLPAPLPNQPITLLIGPESGFDPREVEHARNQGFHPTLLGERILRTETAGLATLAALQATWGDF